MSINYHAFQNKGFLLSGFEVICDQWRKDFTGFDPERAAGILNLDFDEDFVYMIYYGRTFRLRRTDGVLERKLSEEEITAAETLQETTVAGAIVGKQAYRSSLRGAETAPGNNLRGAETTLGNNLRGSSQPRRANSYLGTDSVFRDSALDLETEAVFKSGAEAGWTEDVYFNEAMSLYHYLKDVKDHHGFAGVWIPNYSLDPRAVRKKDFLGASFARDVAGRTELLERVCREKGGREIPTKADLGFEFDAFRQVPVQIHYYEEDDDFPAQMQMLVDRQVTDYLNLECTGCLFADLFEMLERAMRQEDMV